MRYQLAFAIVITATTLSSFNGIFIRALADMTDWQIVFWRHFLMGLTLCLGLLFYYRSDFINAFKTIGRPGIFGAVAFGLSTLFLTMALHNSSIANVMFILALVPILTALIAWVILKERIQKVTWMAMTGSVIGVALMVLGSLNSSSIKGTSLSIGCAITVSLFAIILRWGRELNMIPMFAAGSLIAAVIALPFSFNDLVLSNGNIPILFVWASLVCPLYYSLFVVASRHIPIAELMLAVPLETILSVLLAWLILAETPSTNALLGGIIVIVAVSCMSIFRISQRPRIHAP